MPDQLDIELRAKLAEDSLRKVRAQFASLQADVGKTLGKLQVGVDASGIRATRSALGQIRNDADQFTKSMSAANARVLAFGTAVGVIEGMRRSFIALIKTTVDVEKALTQISVIAGDDLKKSGISIEQFGKQIFQVAKEVGQGFDTTQKAALEFSRQGLGVQESLKRTRDALILTRVSGIDYKTAVDGLTSTLNSFRQAGLDSTTVINKLVAVDNAAAVSLIDLVEGLQRTASVSQLTGQNIDQTIASIATLQEITARGGAQIGNSLKSIFTRIYDEDSLKYLDDLKVGVRDSSNQILPAIQIIENLSKVINDLPKEQQLSILKDLSGLYQVNAAAALTGQAFKELNGQRSIYQRILETSTGATKEATEANKKLSATLASQFNVLDVQIGEILNKFGELGVKNPLGGVLDFLIRIQNTIQGILQGSGPLDQLIQGLVSFSGGALFSTPVLAGGAFVLVKIIKDFLKFASTAFQVFTGINKKLTDQESVQGSISAKIKESATSLNSVISGEQKRLSLTKATTAEYSKQLALAGATSASLRSKNNAQQFIFGEERVIKPKVGQLDSAASKSLNSPRSGVGAFGFGGNQFQAQSLSPRATGERKTLIVGQAGLDEAIVAMSKKLLATGLDGESLSAAIKQYIGTLNLSRDSFLEVSSATNRYVNNLIKEREQLSKNPPKPAFTQGAGGLPAPSGLQGQVDPAVLKALKFERAANPPRIASDLFNASAGKTFAEKLARDERGRMYRAQNEERIASNEALKERLKQSRASGGMAGPSGRLVGGINEPIFGAPKPKGGFDQDAFRNFSFKAILLTSAIDGIASSFRGVSEESNRLADATSRASYAMAGILALNQVGGLNLGGLLSGGGGGLSKIFGGLGSKLSSLLAPVFAFGKGLLRIVPIVGQAVLGFTILNEVVRGFTGDSLYEKIFGGLTKSAERAKDKFNQISDELFSPTGEYKPKSAEERRASLLDDAQEARTLIQAEQAGVKIKGKTPKQAAEEAFSKTLDDILGSVSTGGKTRAIDTSAKQYFAGQGFAALPTKEVDATFANLSESAKTEIRLSLAKVISGDVESIRKSLESLGVQKIDGKDIKEAELRTLQKELGTIVLSKLKDSVSSVEDLFSGPLGQEQFSQFIADFIPDQKGLVGNAPKPSVATLVDPSQRKNTLELTKEYTALFYENLANSADAEIRRLETESSDPSLTENARRELDVKRDELLKRALDVGNTLDNVQFENKKQLILSQVGVDGKTQEDARREIFLLEENLKNANAKYKANISQIDLETSARKKNIFALDIFNRASNAAQSTLSTLSVTRAKSNQRVSQLEASANDPTANIFARESFQRQANQEKIKDLQTSGLAQIEAQRAERLAEINQFPDDKRKLETQKANDTFKAQEITIQTQIQELEAANRNIGAFSSASVELTNSLEEFRRSIAQSQAQNEINLLQSTDASGIAGGLISKQVFGAAEGKTGEELVSFLADQNFLLNEQFKIRTASSAAEKLELETQLELSRELLNIKTQSLDPAEKQRQIEEAINKNLEKRRSFSFGVAQAQSNIQSEIQTFSSDFGRTATEGFRDGLVSAMQAATSQTEDLKDSLLNVALAFANKLRDAALTNLANLITGSLAPKGGSSSGGIVSSLVGAVGNYFTQPKGYAAGGQVTGGSGVKDDVPTLLMGGEYVIPKSTVQEYGKGFFDRLRDGSVGKMAQGGYFAPGVRGQGTISGKENLLDFATQTATSGKGDFISQLSGGAAIASLEPESLRLSNFNRFGDSPIVQATQEAKEQAFGLYVDQLNAEKQYYEAIREREEARKKAKKEQRKQFLISLAVAAVGAGVSYGAGGAKAGSAAGKTTGAQTSSIGTQRYYDITTGLLKTTASAASSSYNSGGYGVPYANAPAFSGSNKQISYSNIGSDVAGIYSGFSNNRIVNRTPFAPVGGYGYDNPLLPRIYANGQYRNSGGYVGGNGDNVPAMLSNKEFVLNSSAAQKLGDKNLYALNNGQNAPSGNSDDKIVSKLDELIQKTIGASNITVSVTMDSSGKEKSSQASNEGNQQGDTQRNLSQKIKETVVNVIREEQRPGGILARR